VGVVQSGNALGRSRPELEALPSDELTRRSDVDRGQLKSAGAHFVIDSVAELMPVLDQVNELLAEGRLR
jgi:phosphonoacetaldehyde hydrolase